MSTVAALVPTIRNHPRTFHAAPLPDARNPAPGTQRLLASPNALLPPAVQGQVWRTPRDRGTCRDQSVFAGADTEMAHGAREGGLGGSFVERVSY